MNKVFNLNKKDDIRKCYSVLKHFYKKEKRKYVVLFFKRKAARIKNLDLDILVKVGLLEEERGSFKAKFRCIAVGDSFFVSDYASPRRDDNVFPVMADESAYFFKEVLKNVKRGDLVLDMFTGSGIIAIASAFKAKSVLAVDINKRALHFAEFNSILNNVDDKITFLHSDLFKKIGNKKFDLITANPPYVPVPPLKKSAKGDIYANSGPDGLKFPIAFFGNVDKFLKKKGIVKMYLGAVGDSKNPEIKNYLEKKYMNKHKMILFNLQNNKGIRMDSYIRKKFVKPYFSVGYLNKVSFESWEKFLNKNNFTHLYYLLVTIKPSEIFISKVSKVKKYVRQDPFLIVGYEDYSVDYILRLLRKYCDD